MRMSPPVAGVVNTRLTSVQSLVAGTPGVNRLKVNLSSPNCWHFESCGAKNILRADLPREQVTRRRLQILATCAIPTFAYAGTFTSNAYPPLRARFVSGTRLTAWRKAGTTCHWFSRMSFSKLPLRNRSSPFTWRSAKRSGKFEMEPRGSTNRHHPVVLPIRVVECCRTKWSPSGASS